MSPPLHAHSSWEFCVFLATCPSRELMCQLGGLLRRSTAALDLAGGEWSSSLPCLSSFCPHLFKSQSILLNSLHSIQVLKKTHFHLPKDPSTVPLFSFALHHKSNPITATSGASPSTSTHDPKRPAPPVNGSAAGALGTITRVAVWFVIVLLLFAGNTPPPMGAQT